MYLLRGMWIWAIFRNRYDVHVFHGPSLEFRQRETRMSAGYSTDRAHGRTSCKVATCGDLRHHLCLYRQTCFVFRGHQIALLLGDAYRL